MQSETNLIDVTTSKARISQSRAKSPRRMRYEAEVQMIRSRFGKLDDFRAQLGLSRRGICQLLLVDPSAWTRWTAEGASPPPHIYRALEWYWSLVQRDPKATVPMGTWGVQAYGERIRKLEALLLETSKPNSKSREIGFFSLAFGLGLGIGIMSTLLVIRR